jgi:hypothetical protein
MHIEPCHAALLDAIKRMPTKAVADAYGADGWPKDAHDHGMATGLKIVINWLRFRANCNNASIGQDEDLDAARLSRQWNWVRSSA